MYLDVSEAPVHVASGLWNAGVYFNFLENFGYFMSHVVFLSVLIVYVIMFLLCQYVVLFILVCSLRNFRDDTVGGQGLFLHM